QSCVVSIVIGKKFQWFSRKREFALLVAEAGLKLRAPNLMKSISLGTSKLVGSRLAYGCWRIADPRDPKQAAHETKAQGRAAVVAAYEAGYTLFDHADIYGGSIPEKIFGEVLKEVSGMREKVLIATKCGIRKHGDPHPDAPYRYDFSGDYIMQSC